jgi:hypothetical protein|tara:strand:+ start:1203 stop:1742 length:540 start_codon:yes stop_codon:yes gene_type:complete
METENIITPEDDNEASEQKSREASKRTNDQRTYYETDSWLDIPEEVQTKFLDLGIKLGWLRIYLNGEEDYKAVGKKINEGWEFVTSEEVPEMTVGYGYSKSTDRFENCIVRGDVALAKIPLSNWQERKDRGIQRNKDMNDAINARLMSMQDRRMPISDNSKSRVTVGQRPVSFDTEDKS